MSLMMNRRQAALSFGALWTTLVVPPDAAAQALPALSWTPRGLTPAQARLLEVVAEHIVPATDTPGARAAGVPQFVDRALADWVTAADGARIRAGLDRLDVDARTAHGGSYLALTPAQQMALLQRYEAEAAAARPEPHFFAQLKELTYVGYFTSQAGATKALRYDPTPGEYRACIPLSQVGRAWAL